MENFGIQIPLISRYQQKLLLHTLNYYRLACVEFEDTNYDNVYQTTNLIEIIENESKLVKEKI